MFHLLNPKEQRWFLSVSRGKPLWAKFCPEDEEADGFMGHFDERSEENLKYLFSLRSK